MVLFLLKKNNNKREQISLLQFSNCFCTIFKLMLCLKDKKLLLNFTRNKTKFTVRYVGAKEIRNFSQNE